MLGGTDRAADAAVPIPTESTAGKQTQFVSDLILGL